ncbi:hypothetical protein SAMN02745216_03523 [Desulfatibacillum alkenivorans DSM 16219]|jgi:hypothetical protein|uniref:Uncharacterized protein n=1 Tax=Desulfatibacillum alkenivorans DSM 16219 TaxID=1121393 RepID=A0A1M6ST53_9BACT|nr:choice-of-anchor U domain-containing protein [Desulfatibacillum alkenivorans]SHK47903.1 hypothetical protein SAMN02745216_03523 [Desulfatibacillum alkenivorans DSM 16219]
MGMRKRNIRMMGIGLALVLLLFGATPAFSALTPAYDQYTAYNGIPSLDPAPKQDEGSFAVYQDYLIYLAYDNDIYGYNLENGNVLKVCSSAIVADETHAVGGLFVSKEGFLFFHDSQKTIYYANLAGEWPAIKRQYGTSSTGQLYGFAQNPWTGAVWYISTTIVHTYFYELYSDKSSAKKHMVYDLPNDGDQGPIAWQGPRSLLSGEQVGDTGYFHLLDPAYPGTKENEREIEANFLEFPGGLSGAARAWYNFVYAASGDGQTVYLIKMPFNGDDQSNYDEIASSDRPLGGLFFYGDELFASQFEAESSRKVAGDLCYSSLVDDYVSEGLELQGYYETYYMGCPKNNPSFNQFTVLGRKMYYPSSHKVYEFDLDNSDETALTIKDSEKQDLDGVFPYQLLATQNDKLYFLDYNEAPRSSIYEYAFEDNEDNISTVITGCTGIPAVLVEHPETGDLYVASYEDGGDGMYLNHIELDGSVITRTVVADFDRFHGGNNGPAIFSGSQTVLYVENTGEKAYFHEIDTEKGTVDQDVMVWDYPVRSMSYGPYNSIFMTDGDNGGLYEIKASQAISVATALNGSASGLCYDGYSLIMMKGGFGKDYDGLGLYRVWEQPQFGVLADEECLNETTSSKADFTVLTDDGEASIGIRGGTDVTVQYLKALDDDYLDSLPSRPNLPLGAVDFRLAYDDDIITGTVTVYFSKEMPGSTFWWKYDEAKGWYKYDNCTMADDGMSMEIVLIDGGEGDADGIRNGYVVDPGGPGIPASDSANKTWGDFTDDCFIKGAHSRINPAPLAVLAFWAAAFLGARAIRRKISA